MISTYIEKIRTAILGKDVKSAIADGLECAYNDALNKGDIASEVALARGSYDSLGARLDAEDTLAQSISEAIEGFGIVASTDENAEITEGQILVVYAE
ncbi:MAG: hypothetical protein ACI4VG_03530 [Lachnospiraceae bacterium]